MRAPGSHTFHRLCVLSCLFLLWSTFARAADKMAFSPSRLGVPSTTEQGRRHRHSKHRSSGSGGPSDRQMQDQGLQFMWSLYRKAADADGSPRQHKLFGSNTVRLIRASSTTKHFKSSANGKIFYFSYLLLFFVITRLSRPSSDSLGNSMVSILFRIVSDFYSLRCCVKVCTDCIQHSCSSGIFTIKYHAFLDFCNIELEGYLVKYCYTQLLLTQDKFLPAD